MIEPLTVKDAVKEIKTRDGVDELFAGAEVLYIKRLIKRLTQSHFSKIAGTPVYKNITVRNWNTTEKLFELVKGGSN